jgi:conjugal transfer pilus assembly protein TraV
MKIWVLGLMMVGLMWLSSCTMNSKFSCNATAGDSCLTIEQVDAMTRFADELPPQQLRQRKTKASSKSSVYQGYVAKTPNGQSLWLAQKLKDKSWA